MRIKSVRMLAEVTSLRASAILQVLLTCFVFFQSILFLKQNPDVLDELAMTGQTFGQQESESVWSSLLYSLGPRSD